MFDPTQTITVVGAGGRLGRHYLRRLLARGQPVVAVVRRAQSVADIAGLPPPRIADLRDADATRAALAGTRFLVNVAHARFTEMLAATAPPGVERMVLIGSTRKLTRWPDDHGNGVLAGEAAFAASGRPGIMLHPTMIYGGESDDNVRRVAALVRRIGIVPLPGGGRALVQPIHGDDVCRAIDVALAGPPVAEAPLIIAGPQPMAYHAFVRAVARRIGCRLVVLPVPLPVALAAAALTRILPGVPAIRGDELRRVTEDKAFPIDAMRARLGFEPIDLDTGLARMTF